MGYLKGDIRNSGSGLARSIGQGHDLVSVVANELYKFKAELSTPTIKELEELQESYIELCNRRNSISRELRNKVRESSIVIKEFDTKTSQRLEELQQKKNDLEMEKSRKLQEIENIKKEFTKKIDKLKDDFDKVLKEHNDKYNKAIKVQQDVLEFSKKVIKEFDINPTTTGIALKDISEDESIKYSSVDIYKLILFYCDEINNIEGALEDDDKLTSYLRDIPNKMDKLNQTSQTAIALSLSPLMTFGGVLSLIKKSMARSKIRPIIDTLHKEIVRCKLILEKQGTILENRKSNNAPSRIEHNGKIKALDMEQEQNYLTDKSKIENEYNEKIDEIVNLMNQDTSEEKENLLQNTELARNEAMQVAQESENEIAVEIAKLKEQYIQFYNDNKILPNNFNKIQETIYERKKALMASIEEFQEYRDLEQMDFILELPEGEILTNQWKQALSLDNSLYKRKLELKEKFEQYKTANITEENLRIQYNTLHDKETELFLVSTSDIPIGFCNTDKYSTLIELSQEQNEDENVISNEGTEIGNPKAIFKTNFSNKTSLFIYGDNKERDMLVNFLKRLVLSILQLKHSNSCVVNLINPTNKPYFDDIQIDRDVIDPVTKVVKKGTKYVKSFNSSSEIDELLRQIRETDLKLRSNDLKVQSYEEYVKDKRGSGGTPEKYNINIYIDTGTDVDDTFFDVQRGVINFVLAHEDLFVSKNIKDSDDGKSSFNRNNSVKIERSVDYNTFSFCRKNFNSIVEVKQGQIFITYQETEMTEKIEYSSIENQEINETVNYLKTRAINSKADSLSVPDFISRVIGSSDNYFSFDPIDGLLLFIGYQDKDRQKLTPILLDSQAKPHMLICGTTGGGKSVTLSVIINTLKTMYSPELLELVYVDLKIAEVAPHSTPNKMPQASVLCGTTCGDYYMSVLKYVEEEMDYRYSTLFAKYGTNSFSSLIKMQRKEKEEIYKNYEQALADNNQELANQYKEEYGNYKFTKRLVFLVDEVAQAWGSMLTDDQKQDMVAIKLRLFQLARAAGINIIFVTQDIGKMPGAIVDLMAVRGCTVAPKTISSNALKNDYASRPENNFLGFFGTNDQGGNEEGNRQYLVPFSDESYTRHITKLVSNLCNKRNIQTQDAVIFSDTEDYDIRLFNKYQEEHKDDLDGYTVMFGEHAKFMKKFKPFTMKFSVDNNQAMLVCSNSTEERIAIAKIILQSLQHNAIILPVYTKTIYKELPPQDFEVGLRKDLNVLPNLYSVGPGCLPMTEEVVKKAMNWEIIQMYPDDILDSKLMPFDTTSSEYDALPLSNSSINIISYIEILMDGNRKKMLDNQKPVPKYLFIFDMDKHPYVVNNGYSSFKQWANLARSASAVGVFLIFFSDIAEKYHNNEMFSYFVSSKAKGIPLPRALKKETEMAYLTDSQDKQSGVFKIPRHIE